MIGLLDGCRLLFLLCLLEKDRLSHFRARKHIKEEGGEVILIKDNEGCKNLMSW